MFRYFVLFLNLLLLLKWTWLISWSVILVRVIFRLKYFFGTRVSTNFFSELMIFFRTPSVFMGSVPFFLSVSFSKMYEVIPWIESIQDLNFRSGIQNKVNLWLQIKEASLILTCTKIIKRTIKDSKILILNVIL